MPNPPMNDGLLETFDLQPTCDEKPKNDSYICWDGLRFTNLTDKNKVAEMSFEVSCK